MPEHPRISVITPSLNQGRFIERTIRSVLSQGYPDLEYIVVDGGSTDGTHEILRRYEGRLRWLSGGDNGQSDAINKGIRLSTGEIIAYLNSDDTYEPGALETVAAYFASHPSALWATGRCRMIDEEDREIRGLITSYKDMLLSRYSYRLLLITNFISQPATFLRRRAIAEFGLFDPAHHLVMDYDYWLRIGRVHRPGIIEERLACFRVHGASKTSSSFRRTFRQELEVSRMRSGSRLINVLHYANYLGICALYGALGVASKYAHPERRG
jgi:glycosyltransferase involved in cell wall biosynthesis